jgi:L-2-hydroxyglutarate oxidase LhgO
MSDRNADLVIIGAGIVGLATALEFTRRFHSRSVIVLEKEDRVAAHQTGHNSGVIHSGLYYRTGSLKARNCVAGCASMKRFCADHGIPYEECGKLVVAAASDEIPRLQALQERGITNGLQGLRMLNRDEFRELEPHCDGFCALHVPSTGIVDYKLVAAKYAELVESAGGEVIFHAKVTGLRDDGKAIMIETTAGAFRSTYAINCAGLYSDTVTRMAGCETDLEIIPFRGEYYEIKPERRYLVRNPIYPVPDPRFPFLGVHFTRHVDGSVEAGPNAVLAFRREGYSGTEPDMTEAVEMLRWPGFWRMAGKYWRKGAAEQYRSWVKPAFTRALQKMVPEMTEKDLVPGGSGVRAQAVDRNGNLVDDFYFVHSRRMIHVCNVPSPAATASLEIGREVVDMLVDKFDITSSGDRRVTTH